MIGICLRIGLRRLPREREKNRLDGHQNPPDQAPPRRSMSGKLQVAYQNVYNLYQNAHTFLEWCKGNEVDLAFLGEVWRDEEGSGTQTHPTYKLGSSVKKGRRVNVYWKHGLEVEVLKAEDNMVVVEVAEGRIEGVYVNRKVKIQKTESFLTRLTKAVKGVKACILEDWNAHHPDWSLDGKTDDKGAQVASSISNEGLELSEGAGATWERTWNRNLEQSRIDLAFIRDFNIPHTIKANLTSDHWVIVVELD